MDESTRRIRMGKIFETVTKVFDADQEIILENLINETMFRFGSSRRTSIEYINAALSQIPHRIEKEKGVKWIIPLTENKSCVRGA